MRSFSDDTIIALSTPATISAIHIIRISGKLAHPFLKNHTTLKKIEPRKVYAARFFSTDLTTISDKFNVDSLEIDQVVCYLFTSPSSYTGEDVVEIHCHGNLLIVKEIIKAGTNFGLRLANPGEFTQRAFLNGKINLEQAEAVDVLIRANSDYFKNNALKVLEKRGGISLSLLKEKLLELTARLEMAVEFPDDQHDEIFEDVLKIRALYHQELLSIQKTLTMLLRNYENGRYLETGLATVIVGKPNSGKSTLMNLLLNEERVIVSDTPGTTRDWVRETITLGGVPFQIYDTAGLRETAEEIEKEGIVRSKRIASFSEILIYLAVDENCIAELKQISHNKILVLFLNKCDAKTDVQINHVSTCFREAGFKVDGYLSLTTLAEKSTNIVESKLLECAKENFPVTESEEVLINQRQADVAAKLLEGIKILLELISEGASEEILLYELSALRDLFSSFDISWEQGELFDAIFSKFCVGK